MAELDIDNLVLNDITVQAITNDDKTGVFDILISSVEDNIKAQFDEGRITSSGYATVYLGSLQSVLHESIQFVMQEQLIEAQIAGAIRDNDLKEAQVNQANFGLRAELEKQWGYDTTIDADGFVIDIADSDEDGKIDKEIQSLQDGSDLSQEQRRGVFTQRVLNDKQAAKLGLDNVMRTSEASRDTDPDFVYTPKYSTTL